MIIYMQMLETPEEKSKFEQLYTKTSNYKVNIPANKKWEIKVWTSYRVFTYTAKVGSVKLATGKSWYPNGLVILHSEYNL